MTGSYGKPPVNAATATLVPRRLHWSGWICGRAGGPGRRCRCRRRHDGAAPVRRLGQRSVAALLELERHLQLGPEQLDLAVLELHVLRRDLGDAQVAERLRRALDGGPRRLLPRLAARADELDDFVDAIGGHALLPGFNARIVGRRRRSGEAEPKAALPGAGVRRPATRAGSPQSAPPTLREPYGSLAGWSLSDLAIWLVKKPQSEPRLSTSRRGEARHEIDAGLHRVRHGASARLRGGCGTRIEDRSGHRFSGCR